MRRFLSVLQWVAPVVLVIIFMVAGGAVGAFGCLGAVALFGWVLRKHQVRKEAELTAGFAHYAAVLNGLKEKEILSICILEELQNKELGEKPVAKRAVKLRLIYTVGYSVLNFILVSANYTSDIVILICTVLTLIYILLMYTTSTVAVLRRRAAANPTQDFAVLVRQETFDEKKSHRSRWSTFAGMALFILLLVSFVAMNKKEKWEFADYEDGVQVVSYKPSVFGDGKVTIPKTVNGKQVRAIGKQTFAGNDRVIEVYLPDSLRSIGSGAFKECSNLEKVDLPSLLSELQGEAFMDCTSLKAIKIPGFVRAIRGNTFDGCSSLETVELHDGIMAIHAFAFRGCSSLEEIQLPAGITEIREQTFAQCSNLRSIEIPEGVTKIGARAFYACIDLESVKVPFSVREIRSSAFRECEDLKKIRLPKGITVAENAFKDSPTKVSYLQLTEEEWERVLKELNEKGFGETVYYITTEKEGLEKIHYKFDKHTILLADDDRLQAQLAEGEIMIKLDRQQMITLLEKAKAEGVDTVKIARYSAVGSEILGREYFPADTTTPDSLLQGMQ